MQKLAVSEHRHTKSAEEVRRRVRVKNYFYNARWLRRRVDGIEYSRAPRLCWDINREEIHWRTQMCAGPDRASTHNTLQLFGTEYSSHHIAGRPAKSASSEIHHTRALLCFIVESHLSPLCSLFSSRRRRETAAAQPGEKLFWCVVWIYVHRKELK